LPQDPWCSADLSAVTRHTFALPARLAAKADPALIAVDEVHFTAIAQRLDESIAELSQRLDTELTARGESGGEAVERELEVRRLSARLRTLRRYGLDLCLGRMVSAGDAAATATATGTGTGNTPVANAPTEPSPHPEPVYIGRLGLTDSRGGRLLLDWRSPAAEPFFGATHANPMGLVSRRRYRWTQGHIIDYWDEVFTPEALIGHAALDDQSAFIASLGSSREGRMRDVLGTIQSDQDAIIRAGSRGALVVDGGPGTGKTVVALHRTAYLLYSDPRLARRLGGVLFVGPSHGYLAYVDDVLPSLGEDGVQICTLRDLVVEGENAPVEADPRVARLKSSALLVGTIDAAVAAYEVPPAEGMLVETEWADSWLDADAWADAFDAAERGVPHNDARDQVWDELLDLLTRMHDDELPAELLLRSLQQNGELRAAFNRAWPLLDPVGVVADLWSVPGYLERLAP
jgi:hypothetical protein